MAPRKPKAEDPFADEAQTESGGGGSRATSSPTNTKTTEVKKNVSDENENGNFVGTIKAGNSFDSPWLVVRADTAEELKNRLTDDHTKGALQVLADLSGYFKEQMPAKDPAPSSGSSGGAPAGSDVPAWAQGMTAPDCPHAKDGKMVPKTGITKTGKNAGNQWKAWMCAGPQGTEDKCQPKFI